MTFERLIVDLTATLDNLDSDIAVAERHVDAAETDLSIARAELSDLVIRRDQYRAAIARLAVGDALHMTGTTVILYEHEESVPDDHLTGWVAHAVLSDGTLSWPMGARTHAHKALALADAEHIKWTDTGPVLVDPWSIDEH